MKNNINFDHTIGTIINDGDSIIYEKQTPDYPIWVKSNVLNKYYRITDLKCTPNIWRIGNIYPIGFCVQDEIDGNKFVCINENNSDEIPLYINGELNTYYWRSYNDILDRMEIRSLVGEYETYYNNILYSEDFSKCVKLSELTEITTNKNSRKYLTGVALNNYLYSIKDLPWLNVGLNIQKSSTILHTSEAWSIYALNQTSPSEHCVQQEYKLNPNDVFSFSAYIQTENSKDFALTITIITNSTKYTYASFFDTSTGSFIKTTVFDKDFNIISNPSIILNIVPRIKHINDSYYRVSISGKLNSNVSNPTTVFKLSIPSEDYMLYYSYSAQKSILVNCVQLCINPSSTNPYQYIRSDLFPSKGEVKTGLYYKTPTSKFTEYSFDHNLYLNNVLPDPSTYEDGDLLVLSNGIYFPDGLKLGERNNDMSINKTLTYFIENEYHETINNEIYRLLTSQENKWKNKLVNSLTFNKFGFKRIAGQQFKS